MTYARADLVSEALANLGIVYQADAAATRTRAELVTEILSCLGVIQQAYSGGTRTRLELVTEALGNLGVIQQAYAGGTRTRAELVTEALGKLGIIQQAYSGGTRTRAELVTEALANLGVIQQTYTGATRTRVELVTEALGKLGIVQQAYSGGTKTRVDLINNALGMLGPLAAGQTATAEDTDAVNSEIDTILADLSIRMVVNITNANAIPNQWFQNVSTLVADGCKQKYGLTGQAAADLATLAIGAERDLKVSTRLTIVDELIPSLVADLQARVIVTIADPNAIPTQYFPELSALLADAVRNKFEIAPELAARVMADAQRAERDLKTTTRTALADEKIPSLLADLSARMIVTIADPATIPTQYFPAVAAILADSVKGKYDLTPEALARVSADAAKAERDLKTVTRTAIVDEYIPSLLADLSARMIVVIADPATIPTQYFPEVSAILADGVRNKFEIAPELALRVAADAQKAERDLKTTTRTSIVDEKVPSVLADLQARMIVSVPDPNVVPTQYFPAIAAIMADSVKGKFELAPEVVARVIADAQKAEKDLKTTTRLSIVDEKLPSIIGELNARAIATVTNLAAIPGAWFGSLADIAAESVKAKFDVSPEQSQQLAARAGRAERLLRNLNRAFVVDRNVDAVLAELALRDIVTVVDDSDIPQEWFGQLAAILADKVKGKGFELDADVVMRVKTEGNEAVALLRELTRGRPSYVTQRTDYF